MIKIPRGTQDILPEDSKKWRYIENQLDELMTFYNYKEIRTPIFVRHRLNHQHLLQKDLYFQKLVFLFLYNCKMSLIHLIDFQCNKIVCRGRCQND
jgi:histidyl-tRNA synthetase